MTNLIKKILVSGIIILATHLNATAAPLTFHADFMLPAGPSALGGATLSFDFTFADLTTYGPGLSAAAATNKLTISGGTALDGMYVDADPTVGVTLDSGSIFLERSGAGSLEYSVGGFTLDATLELNQGSVLPTLGGFVQVQHFDGGPNDIFIDWNGFDWDLGSGVSSPNLIASGGPTDGSGNQPTPMPEPGSLALLVLGLLGMMALCRTRNKFKL